MPHPQRILVVRTDRIGDLVLATPLIRALRKSFPQAYLAALVSPYTRDVLLHNPYLDEIIVDDPEIEHQGVRGFWAQAANLRRHRFDTALLLLPTERLAWMLLAAGIKTRVSVGLKLYEVLTFMKTVSRHKYHPLRHEADYCLDLGRAIGAESDDLTPEIVVSQEERARGREILYRQGYPRLNGLSSPKFIIIHPGTGKSSPNWKVDHYVTLARQCLTDPNLWIVLTGGAGEKELAQPFCGLNSRRVVNLIGRLSIRDTIGVISSASLLISASTGPMHLAAGLGVPTLSMFCRMDACSSQLWGALGNRADVVRPSKTYCSTRCPGDPHVCQFEGGIEPAMVFERIPQFIEEPRRHAAKTQPAPLKIASLR